MRGAAAEGATPVAGAAVERVNSADAKAAEGSPKRQCSDVAVRRAGSAPIWRFISRNGNGGRHCCQPPLRRAKDLPVFVTWSSENPKAPMNPLSILAHQLRRRFSPCRSLVRGA